MTDSAIEKLVRSAVIGTAASLFIAFDTAPLTAGETGIAGIHAWTRVGNKICIADHWHYGNATAATKKAAEKKAIENWIGFTMYDYGSDWMHFRLGESRAVKCEKAGSGWSCQAEARACKLAKAKPKR